MRPAATRCLLTAVGAAALAALHSGCVDQTSQRRGGEEVPDLTAGYGSLSNPAADAEAGAGGGEGGYPTPTSNKKVLDTGGQDCAMTCDRSKGPPSDAR